MKLRDRVVVTDHAEERLDIFLAKRLGERCSRSQLKKSIVNGSVTVNAATVKPHYKVKEGDKITLEIVPATDDDTHEEDIPLDIVYEDNAVLVVNKAAGMVVHPAHGNKEHTLVNALLYYTHHQLAGGDPARPGIVHRLDKDTSGLLVVAKTEAAHAFLARQFKQHTIERAYTVFVKGVAQHDEFECHEPLGRSPFNHKKVIVAYTGGKVAATRFKVLERFAHTSMIEARPETGRTHQIRVHLAYLHYPVLGDTTYGVLSPHIARQALHAMSLGFMHPETKKQVAFTAPLPADMAHLAKMLAA